MNTPRNSNNSPPNPLLAHIQHEHETERALCDLLEAMADQLPSVFDHTVVATAIDILRISLKCHIFLQEKFLLPVLVERAGRADNVAALCNQVVVEHAADESLSLDLADQLEQVAEEGRVGNAQMLGYMLYSFFEGRRRHLAWEETVILPLARRRLSNKDWSAFSPADFDRYLARIGRQADYGLKGCPCCGKSDGGNGDAAGRSSS